MSGCLNKNRGAGRLAIFSFASVLVRSPPALADRQHLASARPGVRASGDPERLRGLSGDQTGGRSDGDHRIGEAGSGRPDRGRSDPIRSDQIRTVNTIHKIGQTGAEIRRISKLRIRPLRAPESA